MSTKPTECYLTKIWGMDCTLPSVMPFLTKGEKSRLFFALDKTSRDITREYLEQYNPSFIFQMYALNANDEKFFSLTTRLITRHPAGIYRIFNSRVGEWALVEYAVLRRNDRATERLLKLGCVCSLMTPETMFSIDCFRRTQIELSSSSCRPISNNCPDGVSDHFMVLHMRISAFMRDFAHNQWRTLPAFIEKGLVNVTCPGTTLTALSMAVQQGQPEMAARLLEARAQLGDINNIDSAATHLFRACFDSPEKTMTRELLTMFLEQRPEGFDIYLFLYYVRKKDWKRVKLIGQQEGVSLDGIHPHFGVPVCIAAERTDLMMLSVLSRLPGFDPNQRNAEGRTALYLAIRRLQREVDLLRRGIDEPDLIKSNINKLALMIHFLLRKGAHLTPVDKLSLLSDLPTEKLVQVLGETEDSIHKLKDSVLFLYHTLQELEREDRRQYLETQELTQLFPSSPPEDIKKLKVFLTNLYIPNMLRRSLSTDWQAP